MPDRERTGGSRVPTRAPELRTRLIVSLLALTVAFGICFWQNHQLFQVPVAIMAVSPRLHCMVVNRFGSPMRVTPRPSRMADRARKLGVVTARL